MDGTGLMKNIAGLMKQASQMQAKMAEMQTKLESIEVDGAAGAGMVTVMLSGKGEMKRVKIDPKLVDPADVEMLEDLIVAAHTDAKRKLEAVTAEEMQKVTGGLQLPPGMKLPF
jgi:DNA-binding YbaB/EbfC family protein